MLSTHLERKKSLVCYFWIKVQKYVACELVPGHMQQLIEQTIACNHLNATYYMVLHFVTACARQNATDCTTFKLSCSFQTAARGGGILFVAQHIASQLLCVAGPL